MAKLPKRAEQDKGKGRDSPRLAHGNLRVAANGTVRGMAEVGTPMDGNGAEGTDLTLTQKEEERVNRNGIVGNSSGEATFRQRSDAALSRGVSLLSHTERLCSKGFATRRLKGRFPADLGHPVRGRERIRGYAGTSLSELGTVIMIRGPGLGRGEKTCVLPAVSLSDRANRPLMGG